MRNLFLVLVLVNLGFAAWHNWFAGEPREHRYVGPDVPNIVLPSELAVSPQDLAPAPQIAEALLGLESGEPGEAADALGGEARIDAGLEIDAPAVNESAVADAPLDTDAADAEPSAADAAAGDAPELVANVVEPAPAGAEPAPAPVEALDFGASSSTCVSVGPFRELSQAATAAANLRGDGLDPVQRAVEGEIWVGYWVYLAAIPTVPEAETILAKLHDQGIAEAYIIPNSDSGNLISLGVFTEIARAGSRLSEVRALGHEATISDRTRRATVYWVDVLLGEGQTLPFESLQPPGRIMRLEQRPCADG